MGIRGDLHVHTTHHACVDHQQGDPVRYGTACGEEALREILAYARNNAALEYVALVNYAAHPRAPLQKRSQRSALDRHRDAVHALNERRSKETVTTPAILAGVETNIGSGGSLGVDDAALRRMDVVIASRPSLQENGGAREIRDAMIAAIRHRPVHLIGHPAKNAPFFTPGDWEKIIVAAKERDVAVELDVHGPFDQTLITIAAHYDVKVAFGLNVHVRVATADVGLFGPYEFRPQQLVRRLLQGGIQSAHIVNTFSLEKLQAWLAAR